MLNAEEPVNERQSSYITHMLFFPAPFLFTGLLLFLHSYLLFYQTGVYTSRRIGMTQKSKTESISRRAFLMACLLPVVLHCLALAAQALLQLATPQAQPLQQPRAVRVLRQQ